MKSAVKWFIISVLLIAILAVSVVLYNRLSREYAGNNLERNEEANPNVNGNESDSNVSNSAAPDFTVLDAEGNKVRLSDYKGKPVVLNFWATWCYYCKVEMPDFNEAYNKYPNVQFLMVNATDGVQETMSAAKDYVEKERYDFDVFFDTESEAINVYNVTGFPSTFFIDKNGNLIARGNGMLDFDSLEKGIKMIIEENKND